MANPKQTIREHIKETHVPPSVIILILVALAAGIILWAMGTPYPLIMSTPATP